MKSNKCIIVCKSLIHLILFVVLSVSVFAQGQTYNWLLGHHYSALSFEGRISFTDTSYNVIPEQRTIPFIGTEGNISDENGNLLMSSNGIFIADATGDTMQNGSGLSPGAYANAFSDGFGIPQGALIIPKPNSTNLYYLFHNSADGYSQPIPNSISYNFYVTTIDMNGNGGLGSVISKNISLLTDSMNPGKIASTKHANGRDWWVMIHRVNTNKFYKFLVTPFVILGPYSQNIGVVRGDDAG